MKTLGMAGLGWIPRPYEAEIGGVAQVQAQSGLYNILDSGVGCTKTLGPPFTKREKKIKN